MAESLTRIAVSETDFRRLNGILQMGPSATDAALRAAVNRTIGTGVVLIRSALKKKLNITDKDISRAIGSQKARPTELAGHIFITKYNIPLRAFRPTQTKKGVRVKVLKDGPARVFKHLFIRDMPRADGSGSPAPGGTPQSRQVVERKRNLPTKGANAGGRRRVTVTKTSRRRKVGSRWVKSVQKPHTYTTKIRLTPGFRAGSFAIGKVFGPSVLGTFGEAGTTALARDALARIGDTLRKNVDSQISRFLARRNIGISSRVA